MTGCRELLCSLISCHATVTMSRLQLSVNLSLQTDNKQLSTSTSHVRNVELAEYLHTPGTSVTLNTFCIASYVESESEANNGRDYRSSVYVHCGQCQIDRI